jgi:hypothetical protein
LAVALGVSAVGCKRGGSEADAPEDAVTAQFAAPGAIITEHSGAKVAWVIEADGTIKAAIKDKDGKPVKQGSEGKVTWKDAKGAEKSAPLALNATTGIWEAKAADLPADATQVSYSVADMNGSVNVPARTAGAAPAGEQPTAIKPVVVKPKPPEEKKEEKKAEADNPGWGGKDPNAVDPAQPGWGGKDPNATDPAQPGWGGKTATDPQQPGWGGKTATDPQQPGWGGKTATDPQQPGWGGQAKAPDPPPPPGGWGGKPQDPAKPGGWGAPPPPPRKVNAVIPPKKPGWQ